MLLAVSVLLPCPRRVARLVSKVALSFGLVLPLQNMPHICQRIHTSLYTTDTDLHTSGFFQLSIAELDVLETPGTTRSYSKSG